MQPVPVRPCGRLPFAFAAGSRGRSIHFLSMRPKAFPPARLETSALAPSSNQQQEQRHSCLPAGAGRLPQNAYKYRRAPANPSSGDK